MNSEPLRLHVLFEMLQGALDFSNKRAASAGCGPWRHRQWILSCKSTHWLKWSIKWSKKINEDQGKKLILYMEKMSEKSYQVLQSWRVENLDQTNMRENVKDRHGSHCEVRKMDPKKGLWCGPGMFLEGKRGYLNSMKTGTTSWFQVISRLFQFGRIISSLRPNTRGPWTFEQLENPITYLLRIQ